MLLSDIQFTVFVSIIRRMLHIIVLSKCVEVPPRSFRVWCDFHTLVIVKERSCSDLAGKWTPYIQGPLMTKVIEWDAHL